MFFKRIEPLPGLRRYIECYWIAENRDASIRTEKIMPDGFTEIIFHYGRPYEIKLGGDWQIQSLSLVAGQIDKHFYLRNTGESGMLAIKFKPAAMYQLFGIDMRALTNNVNDLYQALPGIASLGAALDLSEHGEAIALIDTYFNKLVSNIPSDESHAEKALQIIFKKSGMVTVEELAESCGISSRHLERMFSKEVGLSPKLFARIIRFNRIFKLVQDEGSKWTALAYQAGYYDQSHFIRNFKAFSGEEPSAYGFDEKNFANFFLRRTSV